MKADTFNLVKIFGADARYVVPLFQRPYVWNLDDNWKPLWEDVRRVADELEDGTSVHPHFLGAIVLASVDPEFGQLPTWEVIDGQQRLTTLQVLLAAARAAVAAVGEEQSARLLSLFIDNNEVLIPTGHPEARWKVWPTNADQVQFQAAMTDVGEKGQLVEARRWFEAQIAEWIADGEDASARVAGLVTTLRERLRLVIIDLDRDDDAQVIFETLNGRGTPLEAADLVKNLLFRWSVRRFQHIDVLYAVWAPFDQAAWRERVSVGRQFRSRLDVFLTHWLSMRTLREVTASTLYAGFSDWLTASDPEPPAVFAELNRFAAIYDSFDHFDATSREGRFFERLRAHQTTTVVPLLLHIWGRGPEITSDQRTRILTAIDSFLMRRAVCGLTMKDYNNLFRDVLASVAPVPSGELDIAIVNALAAGTAESRYWPTDAQFRRSLETERLYRTMVRARLRSMLEAIEHELRTNRSEDLVGGTLTVEHILPQGWRQDDWPLPEDRDALARDDVLHSLGNLTLATGRLNSTLSNRSWSHKQDWLGKHSLLRLTTGSVLNAPPSTSSDEQQAWATSWDEERIAARAVHLADVALQLWPDPTALGGTRPAAALPEARPAPDVTGDLEVAAASDGATRTVYRDTLADLLDRGDLTVGATLTDADGHVATILGPNAVGVDDKTYGSLSQAAAALTGHSTNGWTHWQHNGATIGDLRQAVDSDGEPKNGRGPLYRRFWTEYLEHLAEKHPDWTRSRVGPAQNWIAMSSRIPGAAIGANFGRHGRLRHELYIDLPTKEACKRLFDHLLAQRARFEEAYGRPLEWERLDDGKASRIAEYSTGRVTTASGHAEYMAFFDDAGERLRMALQAVDLGA